MSDQSKIYSFHLENEPSELCVQARTQFLECVLRLKPQLVSDLWDKAFPAFRLAVIRRFRSEIFEGIEDIDAYLDVQQKKYLGDPDSHYHHLLQRKLEAATDARPYGAFELLSEKPELKEKMDDVIQHFVTAFQTGRLVKLIQSRLTSEVGVDPIRSEFRFYSDIAARNEDKALAVAIQTWSQTWNLNSDWCRDHAVVVLREWLSHRQLSSVGLHTTEQAMQQTGWALATHELRFDSIVSRASVGIAVYGIQGPKLAPV